MLSALCVGAEADLIVLPVAVVKELRLLDRLVISPAAVLAVDCAAVAAACAVSTAVSIDVTAFCNVTVCEFRFTVIDEFNVASPGRSAITSPRDCIIAPTSTAVEALTPFKE